MHVLIIAPADLPIPPVHGGSVQIYLHGLYQELSKRRHVRVTLISPGAKTAFQSHAGTSSQQLTLQPRDWSRLDRYIKQLKPDLIQVDNRPLLALEILQKHRRIPVLLNLHSLTFLGPRHISRQRARTVLRMVDGVICNSRDLARTIRSRFQLSKDWRYHVIYPGVSTPLSAPKTTLKRTLHDPLRLLFVGRVIEQKGVHIAIAATRQLQREFPVELTIVGRTPPREKAYRKELEEAAQGNNVHFAGFLSPTKLSQIYQEHDILLCPSQRHEAFGLVNIEAMQHGLPVVASHIGGIPEAVGKHGGCLIRAYTEPAAFANAIRSLRDPEVYQQYSQAALRHAKRFTWTQAARKFAHLYETTCTGKRQAAHSS